MSKGWGGARRGSGRKKLAGEQTSTVDPKPAKVAAEPKKADTAGINLSAVADIIAMSRSMAPKRENHPELNPFQLPSHPARATPPKNLTMAADNALVSNVNWAAGEWAGGLLANVAAEGLLFLGYPYLAELAQRPEYRVISETIADDATRKWIDFDVTGDEDENRRAAEKDPEGEAERMADPDERKKRVEASGKMDKVKALKDDQERLQAKEHFYSLCRDDGLFGRSHLYHCFGEDIDGDDQELATPIGDGRDALSRAKIAKGSLKRLQVIEAVWTYPTTYNALNPLREDWYNPQVWYVLGKQIHVSRMPFFIGRPVPDLLKPAYSFGGLSLSQMAKPYVDIWLTTRQSVADLIHSFSVMVLSTDLSTILQPGNAGNLMARVALFNALRDNQGTFVINKNTEDFKNVTASLSGLSDLQAQAQEHMSAVSRIPLVKLTGISPKGLNACLTGDTLILTDRGQVPIRDVTLSDRVMTRRGLAPLTFSGITKYATELIEIRTASATLKCTANHPIWIPSINAFVRAENVRHGDRLLLIGVKNVTQKMRHPWHGEGNGGGRTQTGITSRGMPSPSARSISIGKYGKLIEGLSQMGFISTISTTIRKIIRSTTLSLCLESFTPRITTLNGIFACEAVVLNPYPVCNAERHSSLRSFPARRNFAATPAYSPIDEQTARLTQNLHRTAFASCAARLSSQIAKMRSFVRANVQPRAKTAPDINAHTISRIPKNTSEARPLASADDSGGVISVRRIWASEPVYDLTVGAGHLPEFFANRILTHNSSEGEIMVYDDTIGAYQNRVIRPALSRLINFEQLSLWGDIDPEITFHFADLRVLTEKERGDKQKADAERHQTYVDLGAISPEEVRKVIVDDDELPYTSLNPEDIPDLAAEEEEGIEPLGGRPDPKAEGEPDKGGGPAS